MDSCFPRPVALFFEDPHGVAGNEDLLTGVANKLDSRLADLKRILAVRSGLDDLEGMIPDAELDPRV